MKDSAEGRDAAERTVNKDKRSRVGRNRTLRFVIAGVALAMAFAVTIYKSQGKWQFSWNPQSLFAQPELEEGAYDLSSIVVLNRVLLQLQENYVEPERFKPRYMLASGLDEIQKDVAEIVATFDKPIKDGPDQVKLQVGDATETFTFGDIESLWEMSLKYKEVFRFIQENLDDEVDPKDIEYAAINGVLKTLDPHSVLLSPEVYADMLEGNRGNFGGLGIVIRMIAGELTVIEPMGENTPAGKAGILRGDRIVQIGAQSTLNMDISEAVDLLRGEPGTEVSLMIDRPGEDWESPRRFELTRDEIKIPSVESASLGDKIGYIKLTGFQGNTYKDMVSHLEDLEDEMGSIKGLVLDMRGNPGGLLDKAIDIADEFIDDGTVVTTVGSGRRYRKPYQAHKKGTQPTYPIAVLIDPSSASASEIVAGALKNHNRAIILGDTSFGKGSVQVLYELQDGSALKLTIAQYLTPGDLSIQSVGIVPDIKLVPMTLDPEDPDMFLRRWVRREVNLSSHLDHESASDDEKPSAVLKYVAEFIEPDVELGELDAAPGNADSSETDAVEEGNDGEENDGEENDGEENDGEENDGEEDDGEEEDFDELPDEEEETSPSDDPQVQVARDLLLAAGKTWKRDELLEKLAPRLKQLALREDADLTGHLDTWKVDWAAGPNSEKLDLAVTMATDKPENKIQSGDTVELSITVTNNGTEPAHRVFGITEASTRRFDDIEYVFGKIEPGQSVTRTHEVRISSSARPRHDIIEVGIFTNDMEPADDPLFSQTLDVATNAPAMPHFAFSYAVVDDQGNGDGKASEDEIVTLNVYVKNTGQGAAEKPVAYIKNMNEADAFLTTGRIEGEPLEPGGMATYSFQFEARETDREDYEFEIHVYDRSLGAEVTQTVAVPFTEEGAAAKKIDKVAAVTGPLELRATPEKDATITARANAGSKLRATHTVGDWVRVEADNGLVAWSRASDVKLSSGTLEQPSEARLAFSGFAPRVELSVPTMVTEDSTLKIRGAAFDDGGLRDVWVYVYSEVDHAYLSRKVAYETLENEEDVFEIDVPLDPGMNRVKVVTRDNEKMEATNSLYLYRR